MPIARREMLVLARSPLTFRARIATGCVTVVSAIWLLLSRGCSQAPMLIGGGAIIACGASFATAATTHVLPCGGPD